MLLDFKVLPEKYDELSGAIHADGTARFQTVFEKAENPFIYDLLTCLDKKHGVKALINTSFNAGGEPMVHTEEDAKRSAQKMQLDGLVLNGKYSAL
jgi:carbamoyltransferase